MNIWRSFLLVAVLYLLGGLLVGMYMGGSHDLELRPLHTHLNLLGFVMMTLFALVYRQFLQMECGRMAPIHFWLYQVGVLGMLLALLGVAWRLAGEDMLAPLRGASEGLVVLGVMVFGLCVWRNAR